MPALKVHENGWETADVRGRLDWYVNTTGLERRRGRCRL
jgi:hypothetical protein